MFFIRVFTHSKNATVVAFLVMRKKHKQTIISPRIDSSLIIAKSELRRVLDQAKWNFAQAH